MARIAGTEHGACANCGALVSTVRSDGLRTQQRDQAVGFDRGEFEGRALRRARTHLGYVSRAIGGTARNTRVLELGCSQGTFVGAARSAGLDAYGLDIRADAIREARRRGLGDVCFETPAFGDRLAAPASLLEPFDVVVAFELIEHQDDPGALLDAAAQYLAPNGWFVCSTPNAGSLWRRGLGRRGQRFQRIHRVCLTESAFQSLAGRLGWCDTRTFTATHAAGELLAVEPSEQALAEEQGTERATFGHALRVGAALCLAPALFALEQFGGKLPGLEGDTLVGAARLR